MAKVTHIRILRPHSDFFHCSCGWWGLPSYWPDHIGSSDDQPENASQGQL